MKVIVIKKCNIYVNSLLIFQNIKVADNFIARLMGLMGKKSFSDYKGLLLIPCNQIHTYFMKMKIDVIFINNQNLIVDLINNADKGKVFRRVRYATKALEVESGIINKYGIKIGDSLEFKTK